MNPTEQAIIESFIAPHRRERWLFALASDKQRQKFLDCLNHCRDLDERFVQSLPTKADVQSLLRSQGAPATCYVLSDNASLDGREMPLQNAVSDAEFGGWGTIISCIPGRLAYYYDEGGARRLLLIRNE